MQSMSGELPENVVDFLQGGKCVVLATSDEQGWPRTALMSWVVAKDSRTIRVAIDSRGRTMKNIEATGKVMMEILGDNIVCGVRGTAKVIKGKMDSSPFPSVVVEISVEEVKDDLGGGTEFVGPYYVFAPDKGYRQEVEKAVFQELKST